jgi:hypothetical protein
MNVYEELGLDKDAQIPPVIIDAVVRTKIPDGKKFIIIKNPSKVGDREITVTKALQDEIRHKRQWGKRHVGKPQSLLGKLGL